MSKIFLVNVGANTKHSSKARSPIFDDGTFVYVSYPCDDRQISRGYSKKCTTFVRNVSLTHDDPDWSNFTYGDTCGKPRAWALQKAVTGDTLLFWSLLWENKGKEWQDFTGEHGWYLIGAMRITEIIDDKKQKNKVKEEYWKRAEKNVHFQSEILKKGKDNTRIFIADKKQSALFKNAVDLEVRKANGLVFRTICDAKGEPLRLNEKPLWRSSLRSCRAIWDTQNNNQRQRAEIIRDAIRKQNNYDLLKM